MDLQAFARQLDHAVHDLWSGVERIRAVKCRAACPSIGIQPDELAATRIERRYRFKNFREAFAFIEQAAALAEAEGHHPDLCFGWPVHGCQQYHRATLSAASRRFRTSQSTARNQDSSVSPRMLARITATAAS